MNNHLIKKLKIVATLFLVIILSVESFAAIVSDNDGSAFVTKSEFESLKTNFADQITNYNNSIDRKIDGAIASYLAGLMLKKSTAIEPIISNYRDIRWMSGPYMYFTNRRFTEYTTTAGRYVDTTAWQVINPENRRQCSNDGYLWWYDKLLSSGFSEQNVSFMLHPHDVPWAWGTGRSSVSTSRGPSIFAAMEQESSGWAVYAKDGGFAGERGHSSTLFVRPHFAAEFSHDPEQFGGVNYSTVLQRTRTNNSIKLDSWSLESNELADYTIRGLITNNKGTTTYSDRAIRSTVRRDWNPGIFFYSSANLWANGTGGFALKTACGYEQFMGSDYSRVGNSLVEDNRWNTETQFKGDMNNFIYSMWGRDVSSLGDINVAPPVVRADFDYLDLSKSPNGIIVPFNVRNIGFSAQNSYQNSNSEYFRYGNFQTHSPNDTIKGTMNLTFPLFYRVKWSDMLSGEFKFHGNSLCKSDGLPIVEDIDQAGEIKLKIKYEEKTANDPSVVSLVADQKIKTYFKNKPFTDSTGTFWKGFTNLEGTGSAVELNGTEWTEKEITVNIAVKKGDSIWMRIDPLTADGVYCEMTDMSCILVTE